jgi:prevent-host-death family protein
VLSGAAGLCKQRTTPGGATGRERLASGMIYYYTSQMTSHFKPTMKTWSVQDAKARFSELVATCLRDGPQLVTRRGEKAVVLVPADEWDRLSEQRRPTLKELLLADWARTDTLVPPRRRMRRRPPPTFD